MRATGQSKTIPATVFVLVMLVIGTIAGFYFYNIVQWVNFPNFGFGYRTATGIDTVGVLTERGRHLGLRVGDQITRLNGRPFATIQERRSLTNYELGASNIYTIDRDGVQLDIEIENIAYGLQPVFEKSGLPFLSGLLYISIGILIFSMKPFERNSWIFLLWSATFGLFLVFLYQSGPLKPLWLENVNIFAYTFIPAVFLHLTFCFPQERHLLKRFPVVQIVPYFLSSLLFLRIRTLTYNIFGTPQPWLTITVVYIALGVLFFLGSCLQLRLSSRSHIVKLRSRVILLGFAIAASLPLLDFALNILFHYYIVPNFNYYVPFFIVIPLAIGYSIVKHDLFDIDAIIKRTYGYVITTGTMAGIYGLVVLLSNLAFGGFQFAKSPIFPLIFILAVAFLFNPVRNRIQQFIDRVFYRLEYDYQDTVRKISETMRSLLKLDEIGSNMLNFALAPMFVDVGSLLVFNKEKNVFECLRQSGAPEQKKENPVANVIEEKDPAKISSPPHHLTLEMHQPLVKKMIARKKALTIYDIWEDSFFANGRHECIKTMDNLGSTLVVPLIYEDQLTGLLALGRKKSGKFYSREDINLLNILANQGAVAIENARMVEEIIEKERVKTKIMDSFGKYVTSEVRDQILEGRIPLDGELKEVTVLFADLRGFTTLTESTNPKEVVKIINGYFSEMAEAIGQNHGLVLQFIGDEIEAVFGAPSPLEDHPTHAVRAAMAMRDRLVSVNRKLQKKGYAPLRHGIGIHTGHVVAANIGSEDRLSYALVGDTVNAASRIQSLNKEFNTDILISAITLKRLSVFISGEKLGATAVKGKKDPVEIFKLA